MRKKEFILGMVIISLCVIAWTLIAKPPTNTTKYVKIERQYTIETTTDEEGNVEVIVK